MPYEAYKHLHVTLVGLSVILFVIRFAWHAIGSSWAQKKWVKVVPHIIDTLLLLSIVGLLVQLGQWPWTTAWLANKTVGLLGYIGFGIVAMKATTTQGRAIGFAGAMLFILALLHVAYSKQALIG
ncbi:SirB2 family protein [Pseudidiomarina taiwanensis]|uniref:Invasion protein n=1 Tax=Pseudidiomarina taiwanensis TaxID=337250 RepID=A0A432ZP02_9GAMM|nr:SirB2 family protein [Pseudidiomarina taiwanensis]RUO79617.1 invasion protein [Pseudidiomarina taiwanensis]